jgi:hypothetical protein
VSIAAAASLVASCMYFKLLPHMLAIVTTTLAVIMTKTFMVFLVVFAPAFTFAKAKSQPIRVCLVGPWFLEKPL